MTTTINKAPKWFLITVILLLIWNLFGIMNFIMQLNMTEEMIASLPLEQQKFYTEFTLLSKSAFAAGVFGGALGCIALLFKRSIAKTLFWISFIGIIIQTNHNLSIDTGEIQSTIIGMAMVLIILTFFSLYITKKAINRNWIA